MKKAHQDGGMDILFSCLHVGSGPTACIVFFSLLSGKALFMGCEPPAHYARQPCSDRGSGEAVDGVIQTLLKHVLAVVDLNQPAYRPP
eukprot:scaffold73608_cov12-Tisochrysis_lutea.AAC.1